MWRPESPDARRRRNVVPDERRLAGLARSGDGHDPRRQLVGQETDEVVDEGAFEGVHEMMISARRSIINK